VCYSLWYNAPTMLPQHPSTPPSTPCLAESKGAAKGLRTRDYIRLTQLDFRELLMHYTTICKNNLVLLKMGEIIV